MYFVHLHEKKAIQDDIAAWVHDDKEFHYPKFTTMNQSDRIFNCWNVFHDPPLYLSFREYCNDILRWGTSECARKTFFQGENYRTNWAWGFARLTTADGRYLK